MPAKARTASRVTRVLMLGWLLLLGDASVARAHPLHTTLAELSYDPASGLLNVSLRVFADDFAAAVAGVSIGNTRGPAALPADSAMLRYINARFTLTAPGAPSGSRQMSWRWCGARRSAEVLLVCLRAQSTRSPVGARVHNQLMSEVFEDQVNMVRASIGPRRQMLLFTKRDGFKPLT